jgi:hypothetical protein
VLRETEEALLLDGDANHVVGAVRGGDALACRRGQLQQMHGFASRVDPGATAFPHRDEHYDLVILSE